MKKKLIILFVILFIFLISALLYHDYRYYQQFIRYIDDYGTYEFECFEYEEYKNVDPIPGTCKIYIEPYSSFDDIYITSYEPKKVFSNYKIFDKHPFKAGDIQQIKDNKFKINNKTISLNKLKFKYDTRLNGTYLFNDNLYVFDNNEVPYEEIGYIDTDLLTVPRPTVIKQIDKDVIYIGDDIISMKIMT